MIMRNINECDVLFCKLQGLIVRLNLLRKFRLFTWQQVLKRFVDFLEGDKWFSQDVEFVHRFRNYLDAENAFIAENPIGSFFSENLRYLSSRNLFHDFDEAFLIQKIDDLAILVNFLEDYGKEEKKSSLIDKIKI